MGTEKLLKEDKLPNLEVVGNENVNLLDNQQPIQTEVRSIVVKQEAFCFECCPAT